MLAWITAMCDLSLDGSDNRVSIVRNIDHVCSTLSAPPPAADVFIGIMRP